MKMVKMEDEVHSRLKAMADGETTMSQVVEGLLGDEVSDVDRILDQIAMIHKRFDELFEKLVPSSFFVKDLNPDDINTAMGEMTEIGNVRPVYESPEDARRREFERLRAMDEFQQNAIAHPEDEVQ